MTDHTAASLQERLFVALQHLLPQHGLSTLMHRLARIRWRPLKALLIRAFAQRYRIDMTLAMEPDLAAYPHFNAFFTRALRPTARPLDSDPHAVLCPVDGTVSQIGQIAAGRLIQAKGHAYRASDLLGQADETEHPFTDGVFVTLYLSPRDYHRIHMPLAGSLAEMIYAPGRLFSVNRSTAKLVPELFARNERVVCRFATEAGEMAMVLVGAIFVGGIETVWSGQITPPHSGRALQHWNHRRDANPIRLERGAEMGRFNLGSTVILLFPPGRVTWESSLVPGQSVKLGQRLGVVR